MSQNNNQPNNDFNEIIKTLTIRDVILTRSEHNVHSLYLEKTDLDIELSHHNDSENKVNVKDNFIIFEISLGITISKATDKEKTPLVESNADFAAIYTYENTEKFGASIESFAVEFFRYAATTHIMAFARKYFYDAMINSGYPRLFLPLISMLENDAKKAASTHLKDKETTTNN